MQSKVNRVIDEETRRQVQNIRLDELEANNFGRAEVPPDHLLTLSIK